jgi:hypothetical protein
MGKGVLRRTPLNPRALRGSESCSAPQPSFVAFHEVNADGFRD